MAPPLRLTEDIVKYHHERWDRTGYSDGLKGEQIALLARVFQLIDSTTHSRMRPCKRAFTQPEVINILLHETRKGYRDPHIVGVFVNILRDKPEALAMPQHSQDVWGLSIFSDIEKTKVLEWDINQSL